MSGVQNVTHFKNYSKKRKVTHLGSTIEQDSNIKVNKGLDPRESMPEPPSVHLH